MLRASRKAPDLTRRCIHKGMSSVKSDCPKQAVIFPAQSSRTYSSEAKDSSKSGSSGDSGSGGSGSAGSGGSGIVGKLLGITVLGLGAVTGGAYASPDFRKTVEDQVPYSKQAFDSLFGSSTSKHEDTVPPPKAKVIKPKLTKPVENASPEVALVKQDPKPVQTEPRTSPQPEPQTLEKKSQKLDEAKLRKEAKEAEDEAENQALEVILNELVKEVEKSAIKSINSHIVAATSIDVHTAQLKKAMDESEKNPDADSEWESLAKYNTDKLHAIKEAEKNQQKTEELLMKLRETISEGKTNVVTKKNKALPYANEALSKLQYDVKSAQAKQNKAMVDSNVMKEYRELVHQGKEKFKKELESLLPEVKLGSGWGGKLTEEEQNSLIAHAHQRIIQLRRQLAEQQAMELQRLNAALERKHQELDLLSDERIAQEREKLLAMFEDEKSRQEADLELRFESELRHQLARQAAAHSEHLTDVLRKQQDNLNARFESEVHERVVQQRGEMRKEIEQWIARLRGIEQAIENRAETELRGRKAQELWLACQSLRSLLVNGTENAMDKDTVSALGNDLASISDAGLNHPFVDTVVASIPKTAKERGVWTENALKERFVKVHRVCHRVAKVDDTSDSLWRYALSYLQSMFVFKKTQMLSDSDAIDPSQLTTFAILDNAKYCMDNGDLEQALRYMNQLTGESRRVAMNWIVETRLLLETKQAADLLLAHASASGLGTLFS